MVQSALNQRVKAEKQSQAKQAGLNGRNKSGPPVGRVRLCEWDGLQGVLLLRSTFPSGET